MLFSGRTKKAKALDKKYIGELYDNHAPWLLGVCLSYIGNHDDAEDVLHDGFVKIISNIEKFKRRQPGSLEAWMRRIMVNTALSFLRDHRKEKMTVDFHQDMAIRDETDDESLFDNYNYSRDQLMSFICELPEGYRTVFNLFVMENYSHKEIAYLLGISENTSKSQLLKARRFLKKCLEEHKNEIKYAKAESNR
ncbi:MAG: sigma-70 family RNA polymerase sigma factor [Bacteroidales bacterium]|jgi:RNA polymerase sigma-70 factor (ECF subfamily)